MVIRALVLLLLLGAPARAAENANDIFNQPDTGRENRKDVRRHRSTWRRSAKAPGAPDRNITGYRARRRMPARIGVGGSFNGMLGLVSNGLSSNGYGFGGGFHLSAPLSSFVGLTFGAAYRYFRLQNDISGNGVINDPNPSGLVQVQQYVGGRLMVNVMPGRARTAGGRPGWSIDAGAEYLHPLSARQTTGLPGATQSFDGDPLLLARLGGSGYLPVDDGMLLASSLNLYYNVVGSSGSKLLGAELSLALELAL